MEKETFLKKIRRLFCMGPFILVTIVVFEGLFFIVSRIIPLALTIPLPLKIIVSCIIGVIFIVVYSTFMMMLKKSSMGINLIKKGAYRIVRHPLYANFIFTIPLVIALWMSDSWFLISWICIIISAHLVVKAEEKYLIKKFGEEYTIYKRQVPALIPYKGVVNL